MREASEVAAEALRDAIQAWSDAGLAEVFNTLTTSVWRTNLARHEEELGDDATTLGTLCARNLANRVQARVADVRREASRSSLGDLLSGDPEARNVNNGADHTDAQADEWAIDGLGVDRPRGSLRITLGGRHFHVMKAPMSAGRSPVWDSMVNWDGESDTRREIAETNFRVLGQFYNPGPGQGELWSHTTDRPASAIREFLLVWAGEPDQPLTAGWLTVPGIGDTPFIARGGLWWDQGDGDTGPHGGLVLPTGPSFDDKPPAAPTLALRPRPGSAGQA